MPRRRAARAPRLQRNFLRILVWCRAQRRHRARRGVRARARPRAGVGARGRPRGRGAAAGFPRARPRATRAPRSGRCWAGTSPSAARPSCSSPSANRWSSSGRPCPRSRIPTPPRSSPWRPRSPAASGSGGSTSTAPPTTAPPGSRPRTIPAGWRRSAFHWVHPLLVAGIVVSAAADEKILEHPTARGELTTAWLVLGSTALFLFGHALFKLMVWRAVSWVRVSAVVVLLALVPVGRHLSALVLGSCALAALVVVAIVDRLTAPPPELELESGPDASAGGDHPQRGTDRVQHVERRRRAVLARRAGRRRRARTPRPRRPAAASSPAASNEPISPLSTSPLPAVPEPRRAGRVDPGPRRPARRPRWRCP